MCNSFYPLKIAKHSSTHFEVLLGSGGPKSTHLSLLSILYAKGFVTLSKNYSKCLLHVPIIHIFKLKMCVLYREWVIVFILQKVQSILVQSLG